MIIVGCYEEEEEKDRVPPCHVGVLNQKRICSAMVVSRRMSVPLEHYCEGVV